MIVLQGTSLTSLQCLVAESPRALNLIAKSFKETVDQRDASAQFLVPELAQQRKQSRRLDDWLLVAAERLVRLPRRCPASSSGLIEPSILPRMIALRMARIDSSDLAASTAVSTSLSLAPSAPRNS